MLDRGFDQAHGLRRMFAPGRPRVIQIVAGSPGVGRTSIAVNLALALARSGRDTLLVETVEAGGGARAFGYLGLDPRAAASAGISPALEVPGAEGLALWPLDLARHAHAPQPAVAVPTAVPGRGRGADCVLVNNASGRALQWTGEHQSHDVLIVLTREPASITGAYALIKRLCLQGVHARLQILVNRVATEAEARRIFRNLADVARGYLDLKLQPCGFIPADSALAAAGAQGRPLIDAAAPSPAARALRRLADYLTRPALLRPASTCPATALASALDACAPQPV